MANFNNDWNKEAIELRSEGLSYGEIRDVLRSKYPGITYDAVRGFIVRLEAKYGDITNEVVETIDAEFNKPKASVPETAETSGSVMDEINSLKPGESKIMSTEGNKNGTTFEAITAMKKGVPITPEVLMKSHNLDPAKWEVIAYKSNVWQAQQAESKIVDLYQSKLTVKPRIVPFTREDIDNYFATKRYSGYRPLRPFNYNDSKEILEIDYTDLHVGLLAWAAECGTNFDLKIIEQRFYESVADVIERSKNRNFKLVRFVTLGDILHVDNSHQTTTNGTFQQIDGRVPKIFDVAVDMITNALDNLLHSIKAPMEYVYVAGNHDRDTGYYLAKTVEAMFRREPNITFDIEPNPIKAKMYGKCLVGYCHGDMSPKNLGTTFIKNFRKEFGESFYAEIHSGHLHSKSEEEINGIKVIRLPALCDSSYWEHMMGYKSERALICYVWNEDTGKRETWTTMF